MSKCKTSKRKVLITGCSDGGLGAALAIAFHDAGLHVYATARNPDRLNQVTAHGIETMTLDVLSDASIAACVSKIDELDILVNNAGAAYSMPVADLSIPEAKKLFDLNVWSYVSVMQAFLPLLVKSKGMVVNHSSAASMVALPFQATYNASKAAIAMLSDAMRLELKPFGVTVVDLKTGGVNSNISKNQTDTRQLDLPKGSIFEPVRDIVESAMRGELFPRDTIMPAPQWAALVVGDLLKKSPPPVIWRGTRAWLVRLSTILPFGTFDAMIKNMAKIDVIERIIGA